ncbi:MAG: DUF308 domain-containing protein [Elusimicrobiota bacterium]|nr:DUF308 domain-containing protein [Elusimicrobiota bacterium]
MKKNSKKSVFLLAAGIIFCVVGIMIITTPAVALEALALTLGAAILATGIIQTSSFFFDRELLQSPGWTLVAGLVDIIIGIILLSHPAVTMEALPFIVGFWALFGSITRIAASFTFKDMGIKHWWIAFITGLLGIVLAMFIIVVPVFGALIITTYIAIFFLFWGCSTIFEAFAIKHS